MPLEERHTAENIASWVEVVADKFDISLQDYVLVIVHDDIAIIVAALLILEEKHGVASHCCAGHTLQLCPGEEFHDRQDTQGCTVPC